MENYEKGEVKEVEDTAPVKCVLENAVHMKVNSGSKVRNLMAFASKKIQESSVRQIVWNGSGKAVSKVISCVEIMKRQVKGLHQLTDVRFKRVEEYWEPKVAGLERLKVNRDIPVITILLSKDPLDTSTPGYQAPGSFGFLWSADADVAKKPSAGKKRQKHRGSVTSAEFPDFPMLQNKRDKEKQQRGRKPGTDGSGRKSSLKNKEAVDPKRTTTVEQEMDAVT